ncbi:MAG TPA: hypothetical protein VGY53_04185, partial [Isosphaeraceae bacterium]|nr:hypothetical protein [Isosphaeraceae bacterium]
CPEGNDATAWTTWIVNPSTMLRVGGRPYEAIECVHAPKQGRSGGGLYTTDGHVAGVCDFAEPVGNRGLYAAPHSIYQLLDRRKLTALYQPSARGRGESLVAQNAPAPPRPRTVPPSTLRAQSPETSESKPVSMPPPEIFGIKAAKAARDAAEKSAARSRSTWHPTGVDSDGKAETLVGAASARDSVPGEPLQAIPVEIQIDRAALADPFDAPAASVSNHEDSPPAAPRTSKPSHWRAVGSGAPAAAVARQAGE